MRAPRVRQRDSSPTLKRRPSETSWRWTGVGAASRAWRAAGNQDVGLGLAYFGYQQYDKAVQALKQGIAKGGLKDPDSAHLLLGIAQFKAGNKPAALQSFKTVKGDPTLRAPGDPVESARPSGLS